MILSLFLGVLVSLILFSPVFFTIKNRGLNCRYLKKMKFKTFSCKKKKRLFLLDENSLQSQPLFWAVIALPLSVGVMLWAAVAHEYELEWSTSAYSRLMINAQFPFVILALSPILGAFVMYGHRSLQTFTQINATNKQIETASKQLKEAERKNEIDIYFKIEEKVFERLGRVKNRYSETDNNTNKIYNRSHVVTGHYNAVLNMDYFNSIDNEINEIIELFQNLNDAKKNIDEGMIIDKKVCKVFKNINIAIARMVKLLGFDVDSHCNLYKTHSMLFEKLHEDEHSIQRLEAKKVSTIGFDDSIEDIFQVTYNWMHYELEGMYSFLFEVVNIILPDKKPEKYLINLSKLRCYLYGDELAAENQNPPE